MPVLPSLAATKEFPSDEFVQRLLQDRLRQKQGVGLIVGLVDHRGPRFLAAGASGNPARSAVDEHTLFELGSITKILTAAALADAVARGSVSLDDPLAKFLTLPPDGIGDLTLKELITHTSGLPRLPSGFTWLSNLLRYPRNPYANYSQHDLQVHLVTLRGKTLRRGTFLYSNLAAGLLGDILAARQKTDYAGLIAQRVTHPLHMSRTYLHIPPAEQPFLAQPHTRSLRPTSVWTMAALSGAGGILSCMHDMLLFASAALAGTRPLFPSMLQPLANTGREGHRVGLGWMLRTSAAYHVAWHNGGTGGSRSFFALELNTGRAVVILSNTAHPVDHLASHLLVGPTLSRDFF
jgi:CubicO group peptidase (beta-lactamase class C family)